MAPKKRAVKKQQPQADKPVETTPTDAMLASAKEGPSDAEDEAPEEVSLSAGKTGALRSRQQEKDSARQQATRAKVARRNKAEASAAAAATAAAAEMETTQTASPKAGTQPSDTGGAGKDEVPGGSNQSQPTSGEANDHLPGKATTAAMPQGKRRHKDQLPDASKGNKSKRNAAARAELKAAAAREAAEAAALEGADVLPDDVLQALNSSQQATQAAQQALLANAIAEGAAAQQPTSLDLLLKQLKRKRKQEAKRSKPLKKGPLVVQVLKPVGVAGAKDEALAGNFLRESVLDGQRLKRSGDMLGARRGFRPAAAFTR